MDSSALGNVVEALWPLIASGAVQRVGERGTDEASEQVAWLWGRLKAHRRDRGLSESPASREELREELARLTAADPQAARAAQQIVVNTFNDAVEIHEGNFGISNG